MRLSSAIDISSSTVTSISLPNAGDSATDNNQVSYFISGWGDTDTSEIDFDTDISILIHFDCDQTTCGSCNPLKHYRQLNYKIKFYRHFGLAPICLFRFMCSTLTTYAAIANLKWQQTIQNFAVKKPFAVNGVVKKVV